MKKIFLVMLLIVTFAALKPRKITWVALGDSITYLNDHQEETGNRISKGYMTLITEKYPHVRYINQGHNGWTAVKIADQIEELKLQKADVYTIFLGTNDWWQGRPLGSYDNYKENTGPATYYGAIRVIVDKMKRLNKKAKIILITPMQRGDFVYLDGYSNNAYGCYKPKNGQYLEQFANALVEIGKRNNLKVVDLYHDSGIVHENMVNFKRLRNPETGEYQNYPYPEYIEIPFDASKDEYPYPTEAINMTYDGLHPSDKGYQIIADMLLNKARELK